jgi:hypothetical protein
MGAPKDSSGSKPGGKLVPQVYSDVAQASVQEIGRSLHGVVRTALRPLNALVWTIDQATDWLVRSVSERLSEKQLASYQIISPDPQLLYSVVQGVQASGADPASDLKYLYANLLTTAVEATTSGLAHPAFSEILHQMTSDEAKIVRLMHRCAGRAIVSAQARVWEQKVSPSKVSVLGHAAKCVSRDSVPVYLVNLQRLGLLSHSSIHLPSADPAWIRAHHVAGINKILKSYKEAFGRFVDNYGEKSVSGAAANGLFECSADTIEFTPFGNRFADACVA